MCTSCGDLTAIIINHSHDPLTLIKVVENLYKGQNEISKTVLEWILFTEEKLEMEIIKEFNFQKKEMLKRFDELFVPIYENKNNKKKTVDILSRYKLENKFKEKILGEFRFYINTLPVGIKEWYEKSSNEITSSIKAVSRINSDPLKSLMTDNFFKSHNMGGADAFFQMNINLDFRLIDQNVIKHYDQYFIQLSDQVSKSVSSGISYELLKGIQNLESIPELRNRVLDQWNKPIKITVPPKYSDTGELIRAGYSYDMKPEVWATIVARTEIMRGYTEGKIESWKQSGVVDKVRFSVTPDERLCPECGGMDGEEYKLEDANGIIPVHAQCRCVFIPIVSDELKEKTSDEISEIATKNVSEKYVKAWQEKIDNKISEYLKAKDVKKDFGEMKKIINKFRKEKSYNNLTSLTDELHNWLQTKSSSFNRMFGEIVKDVYGSSEMSAVVKDWIGSWYGSSSSKGGSTLKYLYGKRNSSKVIYDRSYGFIDSKKDLILKYEKYIKDFLSTGKISQKQIDEVLDMLEYFNGKISQQLFPKYIKVWRGVNGDYAGFHNIKMTDKLGKMVTYADNSVSSWTLNYDSASNFAGHSKGGFVLERVIKVGVDDVWNAWSSIHPGALQREMEFVLKSINNKVKSRVVEING